MYEQTDLKSDIAGVHERWPKLKLSPAHQTLWNETKVAMLWAVPSFSDVWIAMMVDRDGETAWFTDQIPTAATDDKLLYINPEWFFKLTLDERLFVCSHEILHAIFGHSGLVFLLHKQGEIKYPDGVTLPLVPDLFNDAADYVINDQLVVGKVGVLAANGLHWPELINGDMAVLDAYRLLWQACKNSGGKGPQQERTTNGKQGAGSAPGGKPFDQLLKPGTGQGKTPTEAMSERNETEWQVAVQAAMESAKLRGQLPANLERMFTKRLEPKADWRDVLSLAVTRRIGNDRYTWERLEPQFIYRGIGAPGRTSYGCNLVIVVRDSSGSINDHTCAVFGAETRGVLEQIKPKHVILADCDAAIHRWEEIEDLSDLEGPTMESLRGGGGTSFIPPIERIAEENLEPDLVIYLTDGYGNFSERPPYPVVWGSITHQPSMYPWGEVVLVPPQA
jgi:predicted metal-dependent peptidase